MQAKRWKIALKESNCPAMVDANDAETTAAGDLCFFDEKQRLIRAISHGAWLDCELVNDPYRCSASPIETTWRAVHSTNVQTKVPA